MKNQSLHVGFLALFSGLIAGAGMILDGLWFGVILGFAIFVYILWEKAQSVFESAVMGGIFGFLTSGAGLISLWEIIPISLHENTVSDIATAAFLWSVPTVALGATTVCFAALAYLMRKNTLRPFAIIALLVLNEIAKMWAWTISTYGPGAVFEPHLSIAGLGYALADNSYLLQLATFGGFFNLTIVLTLFSVTIATLWVFIVKRKPENKRVLQVLLGCSLLVLCLPPFLTAQTSAIQDSATHSITIAVMHTDHRGDGNKPPFYAPTIQKTPDAVVLPEGKPISHLHPEVQGLYNSWTQANPRLVTISSKLTEIESVRRNTIHFETYDSGETITQDKRFIMPQGEYTPFLSGLVLPLLGRTAVGSVNENVSLVHGTSIATKEVHGVTLGALLCSEIFSPFLYRKLVTERGAEVLINLGDASWFQGSEFLYRKTLQVAKVHAVQHRAYFIAAQNRSPSFILNPLGERIAESSWEREEVLFAEVSD